MSTPRKPLPSAPLLAIAAKLQFRPTSRDSSGMALGVLVDAAGVQQHLSIAEGGPDGTWALSSTPGRPAPLLLRESAANVLRGGRLNAEGAISFQGASYVLEADRDGDIWEARVSGSS